MDFVLAVLEAGGIRNVKNFEAWRPADIIWMTKDKGLEKCIIQADGLTLPQESVGKLNELSALSPRYPHWMEAQQKSRRDRANNQTSG